MELKTNRWWFCGCSKCFSLSGTKSTEYYMRYKLFVVVKALPKRLQKLSIRTKQLIEIKPLGLKGRIYDYNDYNETINNETNEF